MSECEGSFLTPDLCATTERVDAIGLIGLMSPFVDFEVCR